jgi:hypothetical protein
MALYLSRQLSAPRLRLNRAHLFIIDPSGGLDCQRHVTLRLTKMGDANG